MVLLYGDVEAIVQTEDIAAVMRELSEKGYHMQVRGALWADMTVIEVRENDTVAVEG